MVDFHLLFAHEVEKGFEATFGQKVKKREKDKERKKGKGQNIGVSTECLYVRKDMRCFLVYCDTSRIQI